MPYLRALTGEAVIPEGPIQGVQPVPVNEGTEWDEARAEGCESPQELNLLKAIRTDGSLPEPTKQHEVWDGGRILTRADLAFPGGDKTVLIYVDGLPIRWPQPGGWAIGGVSLRPLLRRPTSEPCVRVSKYERDARSDNSRLCSVGVKL